VPVILLWVATNTNTGKWVTRPGTWETRWPGHGQEAVHLESAAIWLVICPASSTRV